MNIKEIRSMKTEDLQKEVESLKEELFNLRFERATGSIDNPMKIRENRKTIARILTVLSEREAE
jgi:large subunit ribosomal protein L29